MAEEPTDEDLMRAWLDGDAAAFRTLFVRFEPMVRGILRRRIPREEDVEELLQQTFLHVHRARRDFRPGARVRPWIATIALNVRRAHGRWWLRRKEEPLLPEVRPHEAHVPPTLQRISDRQLLGRALAALSPEVREIVELHWFDGLAFPEVAEITGMTTTAVKVAAHRAYKRMAIALEET